MGARNNSCLLVAFSLVVILIVQYARSPWRSVPPGPWGPPILGQAMDFLDKRWLFGKDCKQRFKDIMYLHCFGQPIVVFNSLKSATELLDRRASIYSSRPRFIMAHEILSGGLLAIFIPYGDLWRRTRRAAHESLTKLAVRDYHTILHKESVLLASALLERPDALEKHFERAAASAAMSILYDYPTLETENDKNLKEVHTFIDHMVWSASRTVFLVQLLPWLMNIPERQVLTPPRWKYEGRKSFMQYTRMFKSLLNQVHKDISNGSERPSVSASLIKNFDRNGLSYQEMSWLVGTLYAAGSETTSTTMYWWALAMIAHPEVQKHAQAELDAVVGRSRTPTFSDAPDLPYIQAVVKEILRWRPALPFALPHATTEDDWYDGMFVPKGTLCLANLWHCHHDPAYYGDDAANFNPQRFLDVEGKLIPGPGEARDEGHKAYGFGRRVCVGRHVANDSLFIYVATILWAMNLERVRDQDKNEVPLDLVTFIDTGMVLYVFHHPCVDFYIRYSKPVPFSCRTTPRFPEVFSILEEEKELLKA
ncbi:cytochrome P450 [Multifurca ochricompacta]|uniref:Cytochrome P450 n=1 Tax=Multifurca ochricompacta TaxID=376703 RepID=A0AAD4QIU0_9AGAM|nr:cytochrome P450 [Multifurca ochricompacta]